MADPVFAVKTSAPAPHTYFLRSTRLHGEKDRTPSFSSLDLAQPRQKKAKQVLSSDDRKDFGDDVFTLSKHDFPKYNRQFRCESPPYCLSKGKIQPRVIPPPFKRNRHTNVLEYLQKVVVPLLKKHPHGWLFSTPTDIASSPWMDDYYDKVKRPMDFTTIENRIKHRYYVCGAECIADIDQVFHNCFLYHPPSAPYHFLGELLSKVYDDALIDLPTHEYSIPLKSILKRFPQWPESENVAAELEDNRRSKSSEAVEHKKADADA